MKSSAIFALFFMVDWRSERKCFGKKNGEDRVRKLNVLLLRRKDWIGHSTLLVWSFSLLLDFYAFFVLLFFYAFCFDFFQIFAWFCYDFYGFPGNTIYVKCVHPFLSL